VIIISDTSAITNLFQVGYLEILRDLYGEITVTPGVRREFYRIEEQQNILKDTDWIKTAYPKNDILINELLESLDLGESESIALAIELDADYLIIDEFEGRKIADKLGIKIVGLLGVLILAKKQGLIIQIKPVVDKLLKAGFRLNKKLVNKVLIALGEVK
jgi:hypothetical protein